jgi:hypothetical protein
MNQSINANDGVTEIVARLDPAMRAGNGDPVPRPNPPPPLPPSIDPSHPEGNPPPPPPIPVPDLPPPGAPPPR